MLGKVLYACERWEIRVEFWIENPNGRAGRDNLCRVFTVVIICQSNKALKSGLDLSGVMRTLWN
jgi:hypothetical protein